MPDVLLGEPVAARKAAAVYAHLLVAARVADVPAFARERVEGGLAAPGRPAGHARAARALAEMEAAIGPGTVCLGRPRGGAAVVVYERALVRWVGVEWWSLREVIAAHGLKRTPRRSAVLSAALSRALARMSACRACELHH